MATVALVVAIVSLLISAATFWLRYREHGWEAADQLRLDEERSAHASFDLELLPLRALIPYSKRTLVSLGFDEAAAAHLEEKKLRTDLDQAFLLVRVRVTNIGSAAAGRTDIKVYLPPISCLVFWSYGDGSPVSKAPRVARNTPYDAPWGEEEIHSLHVLANSVQDVFREGRQDLYFVIGTTITGRPSEIHLWATANADGLAEEDRGFTELVVELEYGSLGTGSGGKQLDAVRDEIHKELPRRPTDEERARHHFESDALMYRT